MQVHKLAALALCISIAASGVGVVTAYPEHASAEPQATQETLDNLADAQKRYEDAQTKLDDLGAKVEEAGENLYETERQIKLTQEEIDTTQKEIEKSLQELDEAQTVLSERVAANYKAGSTKFLEVLLNAQNFNDFITRSYYVDKISDQDARLIQDVKTIRDQLDEQKTKLEARKAEELELKEQQEVEKKQLEAALQETEDLVNNLDDEVKELMRKRDEEIEAAREAERQAAIEAARRAEAERRAQAQEQSAPSNSGGGGGGGSSSSSGGSSSGRAPSGPSVSGPDVVANAMQFIGTPYLWGGTGPRYDCSGLTQKAYALAGKSIPRTSRAQYNAVRNAGNLTRNVSSLRPGDLVFFGSPVHHVGIYVGGGSYVHSPRTGDVVKVSSLGGNFVGGGPL